MANHKKWNNTISEVHQSQRLFISGPITWVLSYIMPKWYKYCNRVLNQLPAAPRDHSALSCSLSLVSAITMSTSSDCHPWPYLENIFRYKRTVGKSVKLQCLLCLPKITELCSFSNSSSNLKKHVEVSTRAAKYDPWVNIQILFPPFSPFFL